MQSAEIEVLTRRFENVVRGKSEFDFRPFRVSNPLFNRELLSNVDWRNLIGAEHYDTEDFQRIHHWFEDTKAQGIGSGRRVHSIVNYFPSSSGNEWRALRENTDQQTRLFKERDELVRQLQHELGVEYISEIVTPNSIVIRTHGFIAEGEVQTNPRVRIYFNTNPDQWLQTAKTLVQTLTTAKVPAQVKLRGSSVFGTDSIIIYVNEEDFPETISIIPFQDLEKTTSEGISPFSIPIGKGISVACSSGEDSFNDFLYGKLFSGLGRQPDWDVAIKYWVNANLAIGRNPAHPALKHYSGVV